MHFFGFETSSDRLHVCTLSVGPLGLIFSNPCKNQNQNRLRWPSVHTQMRNLPLVDLLLRRTEDKLQE